jgi:hypothetical protein
LIENETPSAIRIVSFSAPNGPFLVKYFFKFLTERISSMLIDTLANISSDQ